MARPGAGIAIPAGLVLFALALTACHPWRVTPPGDVKRPAIVFLSEYDKHTRVAFPKGEGRFVEFGFGEWQYYGLQEHGFGSALRAVVGGGRGSLSRREVIPPAPTPQAFAEVTRARRSDAIVVEREKMQKVWDRLEARWLESNESAWRSDGLEVRSDPARYYLLRNSNAASAQWLEEMGATVRGAPVWSNYRVEDASDARD